ncbi:MAG: DUF2341 domain-containing protein [Patescibacteria group bacterium]|nr:DUF2341 domain-containing protein [Patescibacteria group bacterium]
MLKRKNFKKKNGFSFLEILIYGLVILLLFASFFFFIRGNKIKMRDLQRIEGLAALEKALGDYFQEQGKYPPAEEWQCLEKDVLSQSQFFQEMKDYLQEFPKDPFYDPSNPEQLFCYHYKTAIQGREYKLYTVLEKGNQIRQVFSQGGERIYTGRLGEGSWFNSAWKFRKKIKIDKEKIASDLENFPFLIYLKDPDLKERTKLDASDIIFVNSDGKTLLKREIENYNPENNELIVWVKIPLLSATKDNEIFLYYGNPKANQVNDKETWDENFLAVFHLQEVSASTTDSTLNQNKGNPEGNLSQGVEGKILKGYGFDGKDAKINLGSGENLVGMEELTLEAWVLPQGQKETVTTTYGAPVAQEEKILGLEGKEYTERGIFGWQGTEQGPWQVITSLSETSFGSGYYQISSNVPLEFSQWNFLAGVLSQDKMTLYINGKETSKEVRLARALEKSQEKSALIGSYYQGALIYDDEVYRTYTFSGILDEIRISKTARTLDWLETSYQNQKEPAGFIKLGEEELY